MTISLVNGVNPLQTTLLELGIVSGRVALLLRSAEIQPVFGRFVTEWQSPFTPLSTLQWFCYRAGLSSSDPSRNFASAGFCYRAGRFCYRAGLQQELAQGSVAPPPVRNHPAVFLSPAVLFTFRSSHAYWHHRLESNLCLGGCCGLSRHRPASKPSRRRHMKFGVCVPTPCLLVPRAA